MTFHKYLALTLGIMCILGCGILAVVYLQGKKDDQDDFHQASMWNLVDETVLATVAIIFMIVFSAILYVFGIFFYKKVINLKTEQLIRPSQQYVFVIKGLSENYSATDMNEQIKNLLKDQHQSGITSVYTVPNYTECYKKYKKLIIYQNKVKFFKYDCDNYGIKIQVRDKHFKKVDGVEHYSKKIEKKLQKIKTLKALYKDENSGIAFVNCDSVMTVNQIINSGIASSEKMNTIEWRLKKASSPKDIN